MTCDVRHEAFGRGQLSVGRDAVTTFALLLHELATNSVKYGALSAIGGSVTLRWKSDGQALDLSWIETGGPPVSTSRNRSGFGSEMIDRSLRSVGGSIERNWSVGGLVVELSMPRATLN